MRIVGQLRSLGVQHLGLFYINEPFLCDWLPDAIRIAKRDFGYPYVFLTSNGLAATPDRVRSCFEAGLDSLKFTLNFHSPSQLAATCNAGPDAYDAILAHIASARGVRDDVARRSGHHCRLSASSLMYDSTQRDLLASSLEMIESSVDEHYWLPFLGRRDLAPGGTQPAPGAGDGLLRKPVPCWSLFTEAHVCANGHLSACCLDPSPRFDMGDLARMPFESAWNGEAFRNLRRAHLNGDIVGTACAQCIGYR